MSYWHRKYLAKPCGIGLQPTLRSEVAYIQIVRANVHSQSRKDSPHHFWEMSDCVKCEELAQFAKGFQYTSTIIWVCTRNAVENTCARRGSWSLKSNFRKFLSLLFLPQQTSEGILGLFSRRDRSFWRRTRRLQAHQFSFITCLWNFRRRLANLQSSKIPPAL